MIGPYCRHGLAAQLSAVGAIVQCIETCGLERWRDKRNGFYIHGVRALKQSMLHRLSEHRYFESIFTTTSLRSMEKLSYA